MDYTTVSGYGVDDQRLSQERNDGNITSLTFFGRAAGSLGDPLMPVPPRVFIDMFGYEGSRLGTRSW